MKIVQITKENKLLEKGVAHFWKQWGDASNFEFYKNCMENSLSNDNLLPKFYLLLEDHNIILCVVDQ